MKNEIENGWLRVEELGFCYAGEREKALSGVSFSLKRGEIGVICGATGSGKSTLLRMIKRELTPRGDAEGSVFLGGTLISGLSDREAAARIGFVAQRPEQQIVTDRVWHELAFGLECLGYPGNEMRRSVAETAAFFGIEEWFEAKTEELSGGQKQLLNLAAATVTRPELLLLDEPTARLDPVSTAGFLSAVERLNRETGMTVLMAEHRLDEILPAADTLMIMRGGRIIRQGKPGEVCSSLSGGDPEAEFMPAPVRIYRAVPIEDQCPISISEGRKWLADCLDGASGERDRKNYTGKPGINSSEEPARSDSSGINSSKKPACSDTSGTNSLKTTSNPVPALEFRQVSFRFSRKGKDILRSTSFEVRDGEIFCLLGGNGSGKTTALRTAAGLIRPYSGEVRFFGKKARDDARGSLYHHGIAMLPQDPQTLFLKATVREELEDAGIRAGKAEEDNSIPFRLDRFMSRHPYDLSGGEQQLLALAKILAAQPRLLLLDEPTNGLDSIWRGRMTDILRELRAKGISILAVTHDTEFAAETADRCALLFRGEVLAPADPVEFFSQSSYYATAARRMSQGLLPGCVRVEDAAEQLKKGLDEGTFTSS